MSINAKHQNEYFPIDSFMLERNFLKDPLMSTIKLARYKFAAKMLSSDDTLLDLGCGNGFGSYFFSRFCREVTGMDLYSQIPDASSRFKDKNVNFITGDILSPPAIIADKSFSAISMIDVIEHFYRDDGEKIIKTYINNLSQNGMMIIGTPSKYSSEYRSESGKKEHFHEYTPEELKEMCDRYFGRTILFSMNDETVHTGFSKLAWFVFLLCFK